MNLKEKDFMLFSLIVSAVGIFLMFLANKMTLNQIDVINISKVNTSHTIVKVRGLIKEIHTTEKGTTFIKLEDSTEKITVVFFKGTLHALPEIGSKVEILGKPQIYKGEIEIIGLKLRKLP